MAAMHSAGINAGGITAKSASSYQKDQKVGGFNLKSGKSHTHSVHGAGGGSEVLALSMADVMASASAESCEQQEEPEEAQQAQV
jgi:hypothetical protein